MALISAMISSPAVAAPFLILFLLTCSKCFTLWKQYKIIRLNACKSEPRLRQRLWLNGFDMSLQFLDWVHSNVYLQNFSLLFPDTGKTISMRLAGERKIKTIDPENARHILASRDYEKGVVLGKALHPAMGDGILGAKGPIWAKGRALIRPVFSRKQITDLQSYETHFQDLLAIIPGDGSTVDLKPLFLHFTFDTSSKLLLGASPHTLRLYPSPEASEVEDSFDYVGTQMLDRVIRGPLMFTHRDPKFFKSCETLHKYFDSYIDQAIQISNQPNAQEAWEREMPGTADSYVLLREALKTTSDRVWLRDQLISSLVGGRDTTASLMSIAMHFISKNQAVAQKLREEIDRLQGAIPSYETFKDMPYLEAVINETLRLYPVVPQIDREAQKDTFLPTGGGPDEKSPIFVAKGQSIQVFIYGMQRDQDIWGPDANEFRPERWEKLPRNNTFGFMPFGSGGHTCPGQQLAYLGTSFMITRLFQSFRRFENRDETPLVEDLGISFSSKYGIYMGCFRK